MWMTPAFPHPCKLKWMRVWQQLLTVKQTLIHMFRHCSGTSVEVSYLQNRFEQLWQCLVTEIGHLLIKVGWLFWTEVNLSSGLLLFHMNFLVLITAKLQKRWRKRMAETNAQGKRRMESVSSNSAKSHYFKMLITINVVQVWKLPWIC